MSRGAAVLTAIVGALLATTPASAIVIKGSGTDGQSPGSTRNKVRVEARVAGSGEASGKLETEGRKGEGPHGPLWEGFEGTVTCVAVKQNRVIVGAFGHDWEAAASNGEKLPLPGSYAQLLTVEFGEFLHGDGGEEPFWDSFGSEDEHGLGVAAMEPPSCRFPGDFTHQAQPSGGGQIWMAPAITSPAEGAKVGTTVKLKGIGQALQTLHVIDLPLEGVETLQRATVSKHGKWGATLRNLTPGLHRIFVGMDHSPGGPNETYETIVTVQ